MKFTLPRFSPRFSFRLVRAGLWLALVAGGCREPAGAAEVLRITWPSQNTAAPASANPELAPYLPWLRPALANLSESSLIQLALTQASQLGVSEKEAGRLGALLERRYEAIAADPVFKDVPSALPYCFADKRARQGLAYVYRPNRATTAQTPVIVFMHGEGGGFLYYIYQLAQWFPGYLIICPAYGIEPSTMPAAYLTECLRAASIRCGHPLAQATLMGISAGGLGASRAYASAPENYRQLVLLAACLPEAAARNWPAATVTRIVVGAREEAVQSGEFGLVLKTLSARSPSLQTRILPKTDQFFLLTNPEDSRRVLTAWIAPTLKK